MALIWPLFNLLQVTVIVAWNVVWITLAAVATLFTWNSDTALIIARRWYARPILWACGGRLEESPLPDVDWSQPHIFVMNHQSILDIPVAFAVLPANLRFVAKHSLKWIPFLGWYMSMTRMVFINRGKRHEAFKSLQEAGAADPRGRQHHRLPRGHPLPGRTAAGVQEGHLRAGRGVGRARWSRWWWRARAGCGRATPSASARAPSA